MPTMATLEQKAATFENPARQILLEFLDDELGQASLLLRPRLKARSVSGNGLVQNRLFRVAPGISAISGRSVR
ncbi:hypothetical protein ACFL5O_04505 [Myxococcota bacterium]